MEARRGLLTCFIYTDFSRQSQWRPYWRPQSAPWWQKIANDPWHDLSTLPGVKERADSNGHTQNHVQPKIKAPPGGEILQMTICFV